MRHQFLIFIDGLFKPFYKIANVLKWKKKPAYENQHFVVLKFFGLGSITRIVHVMNVINISKHQVTFVTLHKNKSIIDLLDLNAIYVKTKHPLVLISSLSKLVLQIWKFKKTTILDMERASNISGLFRLTVGFRKPCHSLYFKPKNQNKRGQFFVSLKNKPATYAIAEMFNRTYISPIEKEFTSNVSNKIFVNINSGDYLPERKFTLSKYVTLLKTLYDKSNNWHFYLTGIKSEYNHVESFKEHLINFGIPSSQILNIAGQHNLSEFVTLLQGAKLFITNDSGPLHLAYFFNVKTVGIWGPTSSRLVGYEDSKLMLNFNADIDCAPCFIHPKSQVAKICKGDITCFKARNTDEIATKIINFVKLEKDKELIT